ncbi:MAG: cobalamin biosynthesis protein CbiK [Thermodesulfobacteria bacterium]|nr:cobalamin biosynthesis protein CbiK [Thermodesulfobacteriota bacterium]
MKKPLLNVLLSIFIVFWTFSLGFSYAITYVDEKSPPLKAKPAIVLCAFGTSTKAKVTFDVIDKEVKAHFPGYHIVWAFTSDIIIHKVNQIYKRRHIHKRLYNLQEVLAKLYAEGYRKVIVQPLHIFPGTEYEKVIKICKKFPGLRIVVGEPLFYRWERVHEVLETVSKEFLKPDEGLNILVAHGTPVTIIRDNITYLGLDWLVRHKYSNVLVGTVEGVPSAEEVLNEAKKYPVKRVRFIPFMLVAGDHIMHDIMGKNLEEKSWRERLEEAGIQVECVTTKVNGKTYYKGLGLYPKVVELFIESIQRCIKIMKEY